MAVITKLKELLHNINIKLVEMGVQSNVPFKTLMLLSTWCKDTTTPIMMEN